MIPASHSQCAVPDGWQSIRVRDVCDSIDYGHTASADFRIRTPKFLRITDIQNGQVSWNTVPGVSISPQDAVTNCLYDGDIVFARTGGTTGKSFLVRKPPEAVFASYLIRMRLKSIVDPDFLFSFFQSDGYWSQVNAHARGGAQPNVNATLLGSISLGLPPLKEQKRIAGILKEQLAAVERARSAATTQLQAAQALPAAYLREVFGTFDHESHEWKRIGDVCELLPSKSIATAGDVEVQAITTACLTESGFDPSGIKTARMWSQDIGESEVSANEVLVARSNTPELVGRAAMFPGHPKGIVASDLTIRIRVREPVRPRFLANYLSYLYLSGFWKERAGGASGTMKKITRSQILALSIPVPNPSLQDKVVGDVRQANDSLGTLRTALEGNVRAIGTLPAALLRAAFQGQL